jgi:protein-S-isoprenylcysteine O-methyltransferase Ste14
VRKHWFPKPYADFVMRMRVPSGFLLAACFAWLAQPTWETWSAGAFVCLCGLAIRAWAAGHLRKNMDLATTGPYAFTRNPLYLGTLIAALGLAVAARSLPILAVTIAVFIFVYLPVIEQEESHLLKLFSGYSAYAARVPLLLPRWPSGPIDGGFSFAQYVRNQEWKAGAAFLIGMGLLAWKM